MVKIPSALVSVITGGVLPEYPCEGVVDGHLNRFSLGGPPLFDGGRIELLKFRDSPSQAFNALFDPSSC